MKKFNSSRFLSVLSWELLSGRKTLLSGAGAITLCYLFLFFVMHMSTSAATYADAVMHQAMDKARMVEIAEGVGMSGIVSLFIYLLACTSSLFRKEQTKQGRITNLMLPGTNLEKFVAKWMYLLMNGLIMGTLAFFTADLLHMLFCWMTGAPVVSASGYFLDNIPHAFDGERLTVIYSTLLALHSTFLLGSVLFNKYQFVFTGIVHVGLMMLVTWVATLMKPALYSTFKDMANSGTLAALVVTFHVTVVVLMTWLSYRLYCRWQVVTHKLVNV